MKEEKDICICGFEPCDRDIHKDLQIPISKPKKKHDMIDKEQEYKVKKCSKCVWRGTCQYLDLRLYAYVDRCKSYKKREQILRNLCKNCKKLENPLFIFEVVDLKDNPICVNCGVKI